MSRDITVTVPAWAAVAGTAFAAGLIVGSVASFTSLLLVGLGMGLMALASRVWSGRGAAISVEDSRRDSNQTHITDRVQDTVVNSEDAA